MRVTQSKKYEVLHDYQLHNSTLNSVNHCKYLGVVLQSNLRWSKHIKEITAKANSALLAWYVETSKKHLNQLDLL